MKAPRQPQMGSAAPDELAPLDDVLDDDALLDDALDDDEAALEAELAVDEPFDDELADAVVEDAEAPPVAPVEDDAVEIPAELDAPDPPVSADAPLPPVTVPLQPATLSAPTSASATSIEKTRLAFDKGPPREATPDCVTIEHHHHSCG